MAGFMVPACIANKMSRSPMKLRSPSLLSNHECGWGCGSQNQAVDSTPVSPIRSGESSPLIGEGQCLASSKPLPFSRLGLMQSDFRIHIPLEAFEKADDPEGNTMRIGGVVSTDQLDKEGERIVQEGLDFGPFLNEGWFNDNHSRETTGVVGYPTEAKYVQKGDRLPTGKESASNGWWAEGFLLNTKKGRELYGLCQSLKTTPRRLGFSIEGKVKERDRMDKNLVRRGLVKNVAVTHCPVNTGTEMEVLQKALTSGSAITNPGTSPGEGFPLRQESLEGSPDHPTHKAEEPPFSQEGGPKNQWEAGAKEEQDPHDITNLSNAGANSGAWGGINPHKTPIKPASEGLPPGKRAMIKAETDRDFDVVEMNEIDLVRSWAPILGYRVGKPSDDRLTKSEARIMVAQRFPKMSADQVDDFIDNLSE